MESNIAQENIILENIFEFATMIEELKFDERPNYTSLRKKLQKAMIILRGSENQTASTDKKEEVK